jgi:hypothetical protein
MFASSKNKMKKNRVNKLVQLIFLLTVMTTYTACKPRCKNCHTEINGIKSPPQELCGEQLKQAEQTKGMVCEEKK